MEHFLLCLEDDLVALMLLAQVHKLKGEEIKESEILDRCLRLIHNFKRNEASAKYPTVHEDTESVEACKTNITQLLNGLEAKVHLQKAQNYLRRGSSFQNDSFFEFKQALLCNSGDKDVFFSYKLFLEENHQYHKQDKSLPPNRCLDLHVENYDSLALNHLLQSKTSEDSDVDMFLEP
ncbi:hypothetical protein L798_12776 [Zootermopsis nevadensis]|uniref:Uncharacterized protein n=2 Tax=Zootermopsis nevadensis TaxID=136037 RepID=A0A067RI28_ZOONE|nr:hypothetical protein L798_12776 [Zootermopsis nevadensis]